MNLQNRKFRSGYAGNINNSDTNLDQSYNLAGLPLNRIKAVVVEHYFFSFSFLLSFTFSNKLIRRRSFPSILSFISFIMIP